MERPCLEVNELLRYSALAHHGLLLLRNGDALGGLDGRAVAVQTLPLLNRGEFERYDQLPIDQVGPASSPARATSVRDTGGRGAAEMGDAEQQAERALKLSLIHI